VYTQEGMSAYVSMYVCIYVFIYRSKQSVCVCDVGIRGDREIK